MTTMVEWLSNMNLPSCDIEQIEHASTRAFTETKPHVHIVVFGNAVIWRNVNM